MKRTRVLTTIIAALLIICMVASLGALSAAAKVEEHVVLHEPDPNDTYGRVTYVATLYWDDDDNALGTRPDSVTILLYGCSALSGGVVEDYLYLNEDNHWEIVRNGLPIFDHKDSRVGEITYRYEILDLPENYDVSLEQVGTWFKMTCSLKRPAILGDVDGDNDVNAVDVTLIQRHDALMPTAAFNTVTADVNGDDSADILDATLIQRYLADINNSRYDIGKEI